MVVKDVTDFNHSKIFATIVMFYLESMILAISDWHASVNPISFYGSLKFD